MTGRNSPSRRAWREGNQDFFGAGFPSASIAAGSGGVAKFMNGADSRTDLARQPIERTLPAGIGSLDELFAALRFRRDPPRADRAGGALQGMREIGTRPEILARLKAIEDRPRLRDEEVEHLAFEITIAQGLACKMDKIDGPFERRPGAFRHDGVWFELHV